MQNKNMGFDKEQMLVINFRSDPTVQQHIESIKAAFMNHPEVVGASASMTTPDTPPLNWYAQAEMENGKMRNASLDAYLVDYDFLNNYKIEVVTGRAFSKAFATDSTEAFLLNEAAVSYLGWSSNDEAIGKRFIQNGKQGQVIGVIKDFHHRSLHRSIEPLAMQMDRRYLERLSLRIKTENIIGAVAELERMWKKLVPHRPFEYAFLDQRLDQHYQAEVHIGQVFRSFSLLAIFIACLGLLGLVAYTAQQRTKEIGVRKVLGASASRIVLLLLKEFVMLIALAFVVAVPIAYFSMNYWLKNFAYRIEISWGIFLIAGSLTLAIALLTVSYQSIKAALTNPVDSLRYE